MAKENQKTKKDFFNELRKVVADNQELVNFIDKEIELLNKKNSSKSRTPKENEEIKKILLEELARIGKPITITDLMASSERIRNYTYTIKESGEEKEKHLTTQKITPIFTSLIKTQEITRTDDKKKSYYSINN